MGKRPCSKVFIEAGIPPGHHHVIFEIKRVFYSDLSADLLESLRKFNRHTGTSKERSVELLLTLDDVNVDVRE